MSAPFMILSANKALVFSVNEVTTLEGSVILGSPPDLDDGGPGNQILPFQMWGVIADPLGSTHFLIINFANQYCLGIGVNVRYDTDATDDATDRGATITLQEQEQVNNNYQLWDFIQATGSTGNAVFIQNSQTGYVIELQSHSTAQCPIVANTRRISNESYQLWTAVDANGNEIPFPVVAMAPVRKFPLSGFNNYILLPPNQGDHLIGISVTLDIIEDVKVESQMINGKSVNGFSLLINCGAPNLANDYTVDTEDYDRDAQWMQFGLFMQNNQLMLYTQIDYQDSVIISASEFPSVGKTSPPLLQLQNNTIPAGTRIIMNLCTDQDDFVIGITGLALDLTGLPLPNSTPIYWSVLGRDSEHTTIDGGKIHQKAMAPIGAFQVVFTCLPGAGEAVQFTSGMGTITMTASPSIATLPPDQDAPTFLSTPYNSNMPYDLVPDVAAHLIAQPFGLKPVPAIHIPPSGEGASLQTEIIILETDGGVEILHGDGAGGPVVIDKRLGAQNPDERK
jgi:hypothetical protein